MQLSLRNHPAQATLDGVPQFDSEGKPIPMIPPSEQQAVYDHSSWPNGRMCGFFLHGPRTFAPTVPMDRAITDAITAQLTTMLGYDVPPAPVLVVPTETAIEADDDEE